MRPPLGMPGRRGRSAALRLRPARGTCPASRVLPTPAPPVRRTPPVSWSRNQRASSSSSRPRPTTGHDGLRGRASSGWRSGRASRPRAGCALPAQRRHEPVAAAVQRLDDSLLLPVVADGSPGRLDAGRERRLADEAVAPDVVEQLVLGDDAVAVLDQVGEHAEHLRLDRHRRAGATQLEQVGVEVESSEGVDQGRPVVRTLRLLSEPGSPDGRVTLRSGPRRRRTSAGRGDRKDSVAHQWVNVGSPIVRASASVCDGVGGERRALPASSSSVELDRRRRGRSGTVGRG